MEIKSQNTTLEFIDNDPRLCTYYDLINEFSFQNNLSNNNCTIFVPIDEAFNRLPFELLIRFNTDVQFREGILKNHIIKEILDVNDLEILSNSNLGLFSLYGNILRFNVDSNDRNPIRIMDELGMPTLRYLLNHTYSISLY